MWSTERSPLRSIRLRLILALVGGIGSLLTILFLLLDHTLHRELYGRLDAQLLDRARAVSAMLGGTRRIDTLIPEFRAQGHTDFYAIRDLQGRVLLRSASGGRQALDPPPAAPGDGPVYYDLNLPDGHRGRAVAVRGMLDQGTGVQPVTVIVAIERENADTLERRVHLALLIAIVLATLCAAALAIIVVNRGLRPLLRLGTRVATLSPEQPQLRLTDARMPAELTPLAAALDHAFERLYLAIERERRFARDVAHELRTPLAEIRTSVEVAMRSGDPARAAQALGISLAAVGRMQHSVDGLLAVARYESGQAEPQPEPFDLAALLRAQIDVLPRPGRERMDRSGPDEWWTQSDPILVERIMANLLQNAVAYAPPGSRMGAGIAVESNRAWLMVRNAAPGLEPADLPRLGERSWRKDPAHEAAAHGGLGLALAQTLAGVLRLQLRFALEDGELVARLGPLAGLSS